MDQTPIGGAEEAGDAEAGSVTSVDWRLKGSVCVALNSVWSLEPKRSVRRGGQAADQIVGQGGMRDFEERLEPSSVEAGQSGLGGEPEIAIRCLGDGAHHVLRKSVAVVPMFECELIDRGGGIQGETRPHGHKQYQDGESECVHWRKHD